MGKDNQAVARAHGSAGGPNQRHAEGVWHPDFGRRDARSDTEYLEGAGKVEHFDVREYQDTYLQFAETFKAGGDIFRHGTAYMLESTTAP